jgi:hypothetical protein
MRHFALFTSHFALVCALVGCSNPAAKPIDNDPLLGPGSITPPSKAATAPPPSKAAGSVARLGQPSSDPRRELDQLPAPSPTTSTAALAAGVKQTLDSAPRLQIGDGSNAPKPSPVPDGGFVRGTGAAMTLQDPVPVNDPRRAPAPAPTASPYATYTQDQAFQLLASKGALLKQLNVAADGQWHFKCILPDRQNPLIVHTYEYAAPGDAMNAIRPVLDEIARDGR